MYAEIGELPEEKGKQEAAGAYEESMRKLKKS